MAAKREERAALKAAAALLGVPAGATVEEVVQARRAQAKLWHPDVNPRTGSAARMGLINTACDLLCDYIRRGGHVEGARRRPSAGRPRAAREPQSRVFAVRFEEGVSAAVVSAPDRHARVEIDTFDAIEGGHKTVRFVRSEPGRCPACAGLGASPTSPKRVCPDCGGEGRFTCVACDGRGWIHMEPGSCKRCAGTGAGLVERSVRLMLPPGIREQRRTMVPGWGDLAEDGRSGNLWVDLVPTDTGMRSSPWRFSYFGHDWPRPVPRVEGDWLTITNAPLPDEEMRELGFWRDPASSEWVRQAPSEGPGPLLDQIVQRQFFVPRVAI
jgi:DnaJ-class molecular chaperone